jgi:two-component system NtrC family response regulator
MNKKLLVIEDDPGLRSQLRWCFDGFDVLLAEDWDTACKQLDEQGPSIVTLDLGLPPDPGGVSIGFSLLEHIISTKPGTKVIVVTGQEGRDHALKAIAMGAYDYFQKPIDAKILTLVIDRAYRLNEIEAENRALLKTTHTAPLDGLITSSPAMLHVCAMIEKIAPSDLSALILGESGTGKEVVARAIHRLSACSEGNFVAINCASIPANLLESELFGHEKGSFTGATSQKKGKVELADGGTLFLDEIGDMPVDLQAKMLRFLQERVIERVGGTKEIPVDIRVLCATHRSMDDMIREKVFREDLYFRISDITIELPPLRERDDDIILLAKAFLERYAREQKKPIIGLSQSAESALLKYECRGNVRELEKIVRRAVIMTEKSYIQLEDLQLLDDSSKNQKSVDQTGDSLDLALARGVAEKRTIIKALSVAGNNISNTAKLLGVSRPTLYALVERLGIEVEVERV